MITLSNKKFSQNHMTVYIKLLQYQFIF